MIKVDERVSFFASEKNGKIGAHANFTLLQNKTASLLAPYVDCIYQRKKVNFRLIIQHFLNRKNK